MKLLAAVVSVIVASCAVIGSARAADLGSGVDETEPYYAPPSYAFTWTGFYLGLQTGYVWGDANHTFSDGSVGASSDLDGWVGGGYAGYNWQSSNLVFGVEGDIEGGNIDGSYASPTTLGSADFDWQGSLRGRVGVASNRTLFYLTGGWAFAGADVFGAIPGTPAGCCSANADLDGWTLGGGIEYAVHSNFIIRSEYRYTDFGDVTVNLSPTVTMPVEVETHVIRVGAGWKF
jgi:outer membrane immunogenic protein